MAKEPKPLIINAPREGIAPSAHTGFASVRNLDIDSIPGIAKLNNILTKNSASVVVAQIKWFARDPITTTKVYAVDSAGQVYVGTLAAGSWSWATVAGETAGGHGNGLAIWNDYLFVARDAYLDVYGPLSGSPTWDNSWQAIDSDVLWHPMYVSNNDSKLYGGAGQYVFSLEELTTFDPDGTNGVEYEYTQQALDLPESYRIKCLSELGNNLMCGTWKGTDIYDFRVADIFPWDRSAVSFGQPIKMGVHGVHALLNDNNSLIVLAGIEGIIYKSNGSVVVPIGQLPIDLSGGKYLEWYPGSLCSYKKKLFFGVGNGGSTAIAGQGVYSLNQTSRGSILNLEHLNSQLTDGTDASVKIGALLPISRDELFVGWQSATSYGIDKTTNTSFAYTTAYSGYFESPLYRVGSVLEPRTFQKLEFFLAKELAATEGIRIKYRVNLTDTWTTIGTFTPTEIGNGESSYHTEADIPSCEMIQIRVELLGTTTTPHFKYLSIK